MTTAPQNLRDVRALLLTYLDIHENSSAYPTDLDPAEVGIVGDPAHRGGYHCGSDRVVDGDYSVVESPRDRNGLTGDACALDEGWWELRIGGKTHNLRTHSIWMVAQCGANTPDSRDIREIIYSPDGQVVKRWDRLGKRSTGDTSHRGHTHRSYFRDAIRSGRDLTALDRRYFTEIGLIQAPAQEDDIMGALTDEQQTQLWTWAKDISYILWQGAQRPDGSGRTDFRQYFANLQADIAARDQADQVRDKATFAAIQGLTAGGSVEAAPIIAAVNAVRDEARAKFGELHTALAERNAEIERLRTDLARAARAEADALALAPPQG